jgi:hypothetical protein
MSAFLVAGAFFTWTNEANAADRAWWESVTFTWVNSTKNNATVNIVRNTCIQGVPDHFVVKAHSTYTITDINVSFVCGTLTGVPEINWSLSGVRPSSLIYKVYTPQGEWRFHQKVETENYGDRGYVKAMCNGEPCLHDPVPINAIDSDVVSFQLVDPAVVQRALDSD